MVIDIFVEGSYPYVVGGVSGWVQMLMENCVDRQFIIQTLLPDRKDSGKFKYTLPQNVIALWEGYLNDADYVSNLKEKVKLTKDVKEAIRSLVFAEQVDWPTLFHYFDEKQPSVNDLLMGMDFLEIVQEFYDKRYSQCVFTDLLWSMRSLYLPLFTIMKTPVAKADCYHTVSTGYAGILACKAKVLNNRPLILTEHGIYSREREEEIIKVDWTKGIYKDIWIQYFYTLSKCAYDLADQVISLFCAARKIQIDLGCPPEKARVIANGVALEQYNNLEQKSPDDHYINIGAVLRIVPIKDVKTMINAFSVAKQKVPNLKLFLMGPMDENPEYYQECLDMIENFNVKDIIFTGRIQVKEYLGKMDMTILTSISEGQPLSMLESMAAYRPCIATEVGGCRELIYGNDDGLGDAGILVPVMNVEKIADAMVTLGTNPAMCREMGFNGRKRVEKFYQKNSLIEQYQELYSQMGKRK